MILVLFCAFLKKEKRDLGNLNPLELGRNVNGLLWCDGVLPNQKPWLALIELFWDLLQKGLLDGSGLVLPEEPHAGLTGINRHCSLGDRAESSLLLREETTALFKLSWFPPLVPPLFPFHLLVFQEAEEEEEGKGNFDWWRGNNLV